MKLRKQLKNILRTTFNYHPGKTYSAGEAYKVWAQTYDDENDNLMLHYDKIILTELISQIKLKGKVILDYGCGTGRNWNDLLINNPAKLIGCDLSPEMLDKLKSKIRNAETYLMNNEKLYFLNKNDCDVIVSTLVIAHIKNIEELFTEWNRVMKVSGDIVITDFHPDILERGGSRTFKHGNESVTIENYFHSIPEIEKLLSSFGFKIVGRIEKIIDESVKHFYERHNALHVYERFKGLPFIYGIHMSR
jgi:ubiquinone/menaquinone biosynthesis C-methylase UbiE